MSNGLAAKVKEVKAPMPGLVLDIRVVPGQMVQKGDVLLILEAMKMENAIKSATDGVVKQVKAIKGQSVEKNQLMIVFD
jgi:biotin carboxyl carrier protein